MGLRHSYSVNLSSRPLGHLICRSLVKLTSHDLAKVRVPAVSPENIDEKPPRSYDRGRGKLIVIAAATAIALYLVTRLTGPFLPALVWAAAIAVVTRPLASRLRRTLKSKSISAALATAIVALAIFGPTLALVYLGALQIDEATKTWQESDPVTTWEKTLEKFPSLASAWERVTTEFDLAQTFERVAEQLRNGAAVVASGFAYTLVQTLIALFILFYLYRDEDQVRSATTRLSPLSQRDTDELSRRIGDTVHATLFGTLVVALVQGALGGLIFWWLGVPAALFWAVVMGALSVIPYLGAFVVWAPVAAYFAFQGDWIQTAVLVGWGVVAIGMIDNLIYPILVGNRLKQHTVIAFIAILGGIATFGASGIVLGPVIVTVADFLLELWQRHRDRPGQPALAT